MIGNSLLWDLLADLPLSVGEASSTGLDTPPPPGFSIFDDFKKRTPSGSISLPALVKGVREGRWRGEVNQCRAILKKHGTEAYKASRGSVPCVCLSAIIKHRRKGTEATRKDAVHSGLLQLDFDGKDHLGMTVHQIRAIVEAAPFVAACFLSVSGDGVKAIARIPANFNTHLGSWLAAKAHFAERGLTLDPTTHDLFRLCFVSYDPDAFWWEDSGLGDCLEEIVPLPVPERVVGESSHGTEDPEHVHRVLAKLAEKIGDRQDRSTWIHIVGSTVDAVGPDEAGDIVDEYFPVSADGQKASDVAHGLTGTWLSLRKYQIDPVDHSKDLPDMEDVEEEKDTEEGRPAKPKRKCLAYYRVDHSATVGLSRAEIEALRPPYIIHGFLRWGEVLLLGAESKSRKSWLTQDAGFCVATGSLWLADEDGRNGFQTEQAHVHVFDLELNPSEMRYRFAKARANRFPESEAAEMTRQVSAYSLDGLSAAEILARLEELKPSVRPGDLVIVDCLYRLCPDGNEVKELAEILEAIKRFASVTQAGVILVDHFRKAGDDKARNRFAGSFVKQASASTLVAIEVTADDVLVLNIDARTSHGCPKVHARFNPETYAFNRLPEKELEEAKAGRTQAEAEGWILALWNRRPFDQSITAADASERWHIRRQSALPRLAKLVARGWLVEQRAGAGKATGWTLAPEGLGIVSSSESEL